MKTAETVLPSTPKHKSNIDVFFKLVKCSILIDPLIPVHERHLGHAAWGVFCGPLLFVEVCISGK